MAHLRANGCRLPNKGEYRGYQRNIGMAEKWPEIFLFGAMMRVPASGQ